MVTGAPTASTKKGKKPPPPAPADAEDNFDNADDEDEEDNLGKRFEDEETQVALAKSLHTLESDTDQAMRVARIAEAPGAHPLRKLAVASTLDALKSEMKKLGGPVRYPHGAETDLQDHQNMTNSVTRTGERGQSSRQTSVTQVIQSPGRHKFDDLVDAVRARDGGSRSRGFTVARLENPDVYDAYQAWHSCNTTQQQRAVQQETNDLTTKSAPTQYAALVAGEIRKGHNPRVAAQRVAQAYGLLQDEAIAKHADTYEQLRGVAQEMLDESSSMPRTEALRKARLSNEVCTSS